MDMDMDIDLDVNVDMDGQYGATMMQIHSEADQIRGGLGSSNAPPNNVPSANTSPQGQGSIGTYTAAERKARIARFLEKRSRRVYTKRIVYSTRKDFANSRTRIKGRFVKKEQEVPAPASASASTPTHTPAKSNTPMEINFKD
jgi:hypothetical protein